MTIETKNAVILSASIGFEDHGILTAYLRLDYGGTHQAFGGYNLQAKGGNYAGVFIARTLRVIGVDSWDQLPGKTIRVRCEYTNAHAIGHIVKDDWFNPREEFKAMEGAQ